MDQGPWLAAFVFGLGLLVGSFLNVVIARLPAGQSIVRPGSRCPRCGHALAWFENVPLLSWLVLGARCRACRARISIRYPLVELLTASLFLACWLRFGASWSFVRGLFLVGYLVPLALIDIDQWILPFELTLPGLAIGLVSAGLLGWGALLDSALGAAAAFLLFLALEFVGPWIVRAVRWVFRLVRFIVRREPMGDGGAPVEAMGQGDKWLAAMLGAFLGWQSLFGLMFLSSIQGAVVSSALILARMLLGHAGPVAAPVEAGLPTRPTPETAGAVAEGASSVPSPSAAQPDAEDDWRPGPTDLPFGPWLALAGLELFLLGPLLQRILPPSVAWLLTGGVDR